MTPPSQRPCRSSLLKRLTQLLLLQDLVASLQLRTRLHRGLWHPEEQTLHLSEKAGPTDRKTERLGHDVLQRKCVWSPLSKQKAWITE